MFLKYRGSRCVNAVHEGVRFGAARLLSHVLPEALTHHPSGSQFPKEDTSIRSSASTPAPVCGHLLPRLVGYFFLILHPADEEADC